MAAFFTKLWRGDLAAPITISGLTKTFTASIFSLNEGIEFAPLVATILFIFASCIYVEPRLIQHLKQPRLTRNIRVLVRFLYPWVLYRLVWIPAHKLAHEYLPAWVRNEWLSVLSILAALLFLCLAIRRIPTLKKKKVRFSRKVSKANIQLAGSPEKGGLLFDNKWFMHLQALNPYSADTKHMGKVNTHWH